MDQLSIPTTSKSVLGKDSPVSTNVENPNMGEYIKRITQKSIEKEMAALQQQMASDREELNRQFEEKLDSKLAALLIALRRTEAPSTVPPPSLIDRDEHRDAPPVQEASTPESSSAASGDTRKRKDPPAEVVLPELEDSSSKRLREDDEVSVGNHDDMEAEIARMLLNPESTPEEEEDPTDLFTVDQEVIDKLT